MNVSQFAKKMTNSIVLLVFFSIPLISLISQPNIVEASSPYHGNTWYVSVGAQSPDGSAQVFAFYPSIIVIDVIRHSCMDTHNYGATYSHFP